MSEEQCEACGGSGRCLRWPGRQQLAYGILHVFAVVVVGGISFSLLLVHGELLLFGPEPGNRQETRFAQFAGEETWQSVLWCTAGLLGSLGLWTWCWFTNPDRRVDCPDCAGRREPAHG